MPKCGYHPRMGIGLKEIGAGLVDAVSLKANDHSRSVAEQLSEERTEFAVVRAVVRRRMEQAANVNDRLRLEAFDAMLTLGEYFLSLKLKTESRDLMLEVNGRTQDFIEFLREFDRIWKGEILNRPLIERAENAVAASISKASKAAA